MGTSSKQQYDTAQSAAEGAPRGWPKSLLQEMKLPTLGSFDRQVADPERTKSQKPPEPAVFLRLSRISAGVEIYQDAWPAAIFEQGFQRVRASSAGANPEEPDRQRVGSKKNSAAQVR
jgi:hypothetical protein